MADDDRKRRRRRRDDDDDRDRDKGGATPEEIQAAAQIAAAQGWGGDMVASGSTTAPATAFQDPGQDQTDAALQAFFSTGTGPAMHYDLRPADTGVTVQAVGGEPAHTPLPHQKRVKRAQRKVAKKK